jgi:CelD/BcsL family acetyltransferase involved in cellulose biosynthesis
MNDALPPRTALRRTRVIAAQNLTSAEVAAWSALQSVDPLLASPFFRPEFTLAVADVRGDAYVAIIEDADGAAGFFPFQAGPLGIGHPIGGPLSDYQGAIMRAGWEWDAGELIRSCGLAAWRFDHLLTEQKPFTMFHRVMGQSPVIDLSRGYEAYVESRREAGTVQIKKAQALRRKLEREVGPLHIELHEKNPDLLRLLMRWKSQQYAASGKLDIFSITWVARIVERIYASQHEGFAGMLSVLYAGDRPLAAHMGLRSRVVWHYWMPAYDPEYARYSPGILLLLGMAERAPTLGLRVIDMGNGRAFYKLRLMNGVVPIVEGEVAVSPFRSAVMTLRNHGEDLVRHSPLLQPVRRLNVLAHGFEERLQFWWRMRSRMRFR